MDEQAFDVAGRAELAHLEEVLDELDPDDVDYSRADGVLRLELRDGAKVVINTHRAARQIWMAAVDTAWHFDLDENDEVWRTSDGQALRPTLARLLNERIGISASF